MISGYAHYQQSTETELRHRWKRLLRFLIPFWVIAAVFSVIGIFTGNPAIPASAKEFLLNCLTIKNSYNGAWWYANTYILLVALQPLSRKFVERRPAWAVLLAFFAFYTVGYGIRFWGWGSCCSAVLAWIITHIGLLGTSYFPYVIGMLFCKKQVVAALRQRLAAVKARNIYIHSNYFCWHDRSAWGDTAALCLHSLLLTVTIILLCICPLPVWLTNLLCYFGEHSTNIWLVHMFFYSVLFDNLVFSARYPIPVFLLLIALSLASSYVIRWLSRPILKLVR